MLSSRTRPGRLVGHKWPKNVGRHQWTFPKNNELTLKIRSNLRARKTDSPNEPDLGLKCVRTTSKTLPEMTRQSNRLKEDS